MDTIVVLLSSYNGEKYIKCQIDSILRQKLKQTNLILFIRDDGSTDSTPQILNEYALIHPNINVIFGKNIGYIRSFFELIKQAKKTSYEYVALSDQDDRWDEDKLEVGLEHVRKESSPFLYESNVRITDDDLNFKKTDQIDIKPITFYNSAIQTFSAGHTYVFNRKLLNEISDDVDCSRIYAHDAFIHNLAVVKGKVFFDRCPHNDYRQHNFNVVGTSQKKGIIGWVKIRFKRIKKGESKAYARQIHYYLDYFGDDLDDAYKNELLSFYSHQRNFFTRLTYIFRTKFYRQTFFETFSFKILYLLGGYKFEKTKKKDSVKH